MITDRINEWARLRPRSPALAEGETTLTYFEFARMIEAARQFFAAFDLPRGAFAFVFGGARPEFYVMTLALRALGLNTVAASSLDEAVRLGIPNVACVATSEGFFGPSPVLPTGLKNARLIAVPQRIYARERIAEPPPPGDHGPGGGYVLFTSGTTGAYKKILGGGPKEEGAIRWHIQSRGFDQDTVYHALDYPPWTAIGGMAASIWHAGGSLVFFGRAEGFEGFCRRRPTRTMIVPAFLPGLLRARPPGEPPREDLELVVSGGFLPLGIAEQISKEITPNLVIHFGSTEAKGFMRSRFKTADDLFWLTPFSEIEVVDADGRVCAPGAEGEIRVKLMDFDIDHYMNDPETTARFFRDGYFYPGDIGVRREDGRIRALGRTDDALNISGFKIAVAPIEERIRRALRVDGVCVFSGINKAGDEEIVIALETDRRPADHALASAIEDIRGFSRVRWMFLESFPRTERGLAKVDRRRLRQQLRPRAD